MCGKWKRRALETEERFDAAQYLLTAEKAESARFKEMVSELKEALAEKDKENAGLRARLSRTGQPRDKKGQFKVATPEA